MCCGKDSKQGCRKPENMKGRRGECTSEQVRKCHGSAGKHPCTARKGK